MRHLTPRLAGKTHVIWDWNGTLLDDVDLCIDVISELLVEHGRAPLSRDDYLAKFRFPVEGYYRELFDLEAVPFATLSDAFILRYNERAGRVRLHAGTGEVLAELAARKIACSVLSAAHEDDLRSLIAHYGLGGFFRHVYGIGDRYARSKIERGRALIAEIAADGTPPRELVLIGDTDHDLEVAAALGIDALLLTGGHQSEARLRAAGASVVMRTASGRGE
jgi:phosphoglycolate phosphatase